LEFLDLLPPGEALRRFFAAWRPTRPSRRTVDLEAALGRVLGTDITAALDLPPHPRSTVDGYAVRAADTFGATEAVPALLQVVGEVSMGKEPALGLGPGEAARVATGSLLPEGADAAVMVEYTEDLGSGLISVGRPASPGENSVARGEDVPRGRTVFAAGHVVRPQDVGLLAALGIFRVEVLARPRVAVISTGDEVVAPGVEPGPGQVRDINGPALRARLRQAGCLPVDGGIVPDDLDSLTAACRRVLEEDGARAVILSGGSSVGTADLTPQAIDRLGGPGVLVHGLALKPGKPTILGLAGEVPVIGLPGHPAAALVTFEAVCLPIVRALLRPGGGDDAMAGAPLAVRAVLTRSLASTSGREEYVRVVLRPPAADAGDDRPRAVPVLGKSGMISTVALADGMIRIPLGVDGLEAGEPVDVRLWPPLRS